MNPKITAISIHVEGSHVIRYLHYNLKSKQLQVEFVTSHKWIYKEVPSEIFGGLIDAESMGSYFSKFIKNEFKSERIQ